MVVEMLTFTVPPGELAGWLEVEEANWSRFLERQDGFVRKEMWRSCEDPTAVHAVIWWASLGQWEAIPAEDLRRVEDAMGPHERHGVMHAFDVIRQC
jgi:uncharacterized protein (TIGR03792 family)